jgi:uncharacterized protein with HEPN domain
MAPSPIERARHIKVSIEVIRGGLKGKSLDEVAGDRMLWGGYERQLMVISEASRHLPDVWKTAYGAEIDWRQIADAGNALRHAYHRMNVATLWSIYENDLDPLEAAVDAMLAAHDQGLADHPS